MIRPRPARWFEILCAREDATRLLAALAATGEVELEARACAAAALSLDEIHPLLARFADLATRYRLYWPSVGHRCSAFPEPPAATMQRCLAALSAWAAEAEPIITRLQAVASERDELAIWDRVLVALDGSPLDFTELGEPGPMVLKRLVLFPDEARPELPASSLARRIDSDDLQGVLVVGTGEAMQSLQQQAAAAKGRVLEAPAWLEPTAQASRAHVAPRQRALEGEEAALRATLEALQQRHDLQRVLGDVQRLQWFTDNVKLLETTDCFCRITGWTADLDGHRLAVAVEASGARALLHFPPPDSAMRPPLLLVNPWWARPFELFSRALGMPERNEADPSVVLALVVPLLFGYMFGDIGQGLVLATAGYVLRRRYAVARLLIAGGIAAAVFGALFGSLFGLHVVPALWLAPLDAPLTVLLVPIAGGAVLLATGLVLDGIEAFWRGELDAWLASDAWMLVAYVALLGSVAVPSLALLAGLAAVLFCVGRGLRAHRVAEGFAALALLVERLVQILINTLSFARVGAFALAHAGLSSAIVALVDAAGHPVARIAVLVAGNVLVLALETMVVAIQTTRLVLFEFFTRFLTAQGRVFRPLPPPPSSRTLQET